MRQRLKIPALILIPIGIYAIGFVVVVVWQALNAAPGSRSFTPGPPPAAYVPNKAAGDLPLLIGKPAPDFTLSGPDGKTHRLKDYLGQRVMLNFWATWCAPCRLETPLLQKTYARFQTAGLVIIGIDQAEEVTTVNNFVKEFSLTYPILLDADLATTQAYGVIGLPTTFFIDTQGIIQFKNIGMLTDDSLSQYLEQMGVSDSGKPTVPR